MKSQLEADRRFFPEVIDDLANEWAERRLNSVNLREGYVLIGVRTPEGVLRYEA